MFAFGCKSIISEFIFSNISKFSTTISRFTEKKFDDLFIEIRFALNVFELTF